MSVRTDPDPPQAVTNYEQALAWLGIPDERGITDEGIVSYMTLKVGLSMI